MRKPGVFFVFMFLAVASVINAQEIPDPPIMVNTPSGVSVPVLIPPASVSIEPYMTTTQPVVVPVPINLYVTSPVPPQPRPVAPVAPAFPPQPPQPAGNQACAPIDPYAPLPFDLPTEGPITSTVLRPPSAMGMQQNPAYQQQFQQNPAAFAPPAQAPAFQQQPAPFAPNAPYPPGLYAPRQGVYSDDPVSAPAPVQQQAVAPLSVPAPGIPYSLDAQGRPHYVQQPGTVPGSQQWPGYTPAQQMPMQPYQQPQPGLSPQAQMQQQMQQQQMQQPPMPQPGFSQQGQFVDPNLVPSQIPAGLNPNTNPNLTNPNTPVQLVTPAQVNQAIMEGTPMVILDVRGELVRDIIGHIPNDIHVPLGPNETFPTRVRHAIPDQRFPIVVYCNDGINSSQAANMLANMGYKVYLMGIYTGWAGHIPAQACTSCLYQ